MECATSSSSNDTDEELLNKFPLLMAQGPKEKLIDFKIKKHEWYHKYRRLNEKMYRVFEEKRLSKDEIIEDLKWLIERHAEDLASLRALGLVFNDELHRAVEVILYGNKSASSPDPQKTCASLKLVKR